MIFCFEPDIYDYYDYYPETGETVYRGSEVEYTGVTCFPGFGSGDPYMDPTFPSGGGSVVPQLTCADLRNSAPPGCDPYNPPLLVTDGCSVPIVGSALLSINQQYGDIFRGACDKHDICYGTPAAVKTDCDDKLAIDMINGAASVMTTSDFLAAASTIHRQAALYADQLKANILGIPQTLFNKAQAAASCRVIYFALKARNC